MSHKCHMKSQTLSSTNAVAWAFDSFSKTLPCRLRTETLSKVFLPDKLLHIRICSVQTSQATY